MFTVPYPVTFVVQLGKTLCKQSNVVEKSLAMLENNVSQIFEKLGNVVGCKANFFADIITHRQIIKFDFFFCEKQNNGLFCAAKQYSDS